MNSRNISDRLSISSRRDISLSAAIRLGDLAAHVISG